MNKKAAKPTLTGQRIKTRKRDEKEKLDPYAFRDGIIEGLNKTGNNLEAVSEFLYAQSLKQNYRAYADSLIHILLTGGLLAPGGSIIEGPDQTKVSRSDVCVFTAANDDETLLAYRQVFHLLIRRFRYLERVFQDEMTNRIIPCMKGYKEGERSNLAKITAMFMAASQLPLEASCLKHLFTDPLVKDDLALGFATKMLRTWLKYSSIKDIRKALTLHGMEGKLMLLFPLNKRSLENFEKHFSEAGLPQIIEYQKNHELDMSKKKLQNFVSESIKDGKSIKEIVGVCEDVMKKFNLAEHEVVISIWNAIMQNVEFNKKEDLMTNQALRHLKAYTQLLETFSQNAKSEIALMLRIQEYCYENMDFMNLFWKIIKLFYDGDVLSEDAIRLWYNKKHSSKGRNIFLEQTKQLIDWFDSAETESDTDEEGDSDAENKAPAKKTPAKEAENGEAAGATAEPDKDAEDSKDEGEIKNAGGDAAEGVAES